MNNLEPSPPVAYSILFHVHSIGPGGKGVGSGWWMSSLFLRKMKGKDCVVAGTTLEREQTLTGLHSNSLRIRSGWTGYCSQYHLPKSCSQIAGTSKLTCSV